MHTFRWVVNLINFKLKVLLFYTPLPPSPPVKTIILMALCSSSYTVTKIVLSEALMYLELNYQEQKRLGWISGKTHCQVTCYSACTSTYYEWGMQASTGAAGGVMQSLNLDLISFAYGFMIFMTFRSSWYVYPCSKQPLIRNSVVLAMKFGQKQLLLVLVADTGILPLCAAECCW